MALKRKRSDSEISTTSSLLSSSPLSYVNFMPLDSFQSHESSIQTPSLFSSRTRKRHRDNRPSESDVHQHTLSLLFSAQQPPHILHPQSQPTPPTPRPGGAILSTSFRKVQQSSLHSFWTIPHTREPSPASSAGTPNTNSSSPFFLASNCEDCDARLGEDGDMDVDMMDVDSGSGGAGHGCASCGRQVCQNCSVSNLGMERKCLNCAGRGRKWVGGLGCVEGR